LMQKIKFLTLGFIIIFCACNRPEGILVEAESFSSKGGWVVDPQFVEQMGSPYLMAHGMGVAVDDASTQIEITKTGKYHFWVRTKNWVPGPWSSPGTFKLMIDDQVVQEKLGQGDEWGWEYCGSLEVSAGAIRISLIDESGFNGRCDAIWLSKSPDSPPNESDSLSYWRTQVSDLNSKPKQTQHFDLVVVGGGIAGCAAAISAAENGLNVALVHDRPVLGGNASSEIRVHTEGIYGKFERILKMLDTRHYPNGSPEAALDQEKRDANVKKYQNIHLFLNWRAFSAETAGNKILAVYARQTSTGEKIRLEAPLFTDCTGDGWIGYWSGAEFFYGRESVDTYDEGWDKFGEVWSPQVGDNAVMGASVLWRTFVDSQQYDFPEVPWAMEVANGYAAKNGTWNWEFISKDHHQINDGEKIRDHMLKAIFGSFYNVKQNPDNQNLRLEWMSYLLGKRESRRIVGDHIYTFNDARNNIEFPDSVVVEIRSVDVHYPQNVYDAEKPDFLTEAMYYNAGRYHIPYRSLYSKDIENLFMAGRCFSCSHIGLGGPRVMLTTGQMGAAVGIAAALCQKHKVHPRDIYTDHLDEYWELILAQQ
jgi:hypothetical protein